MQSASASQPRLLAEESAVGDDPVAIAQQDPPLFTGPTDEQKQAYADRKMSMMIHYGINTYVSVDGHGLGGIAASDNSRIFTGPMGSATQTPATGTSAWFTNRTFLSTRFNPPYKTQEEFKRNMSDVWFRRAKEAGITQVTFTTKHHFGWCAWDSAHTTYDIATSMAPNVDMWKAVLDSARDFDMTVGLYYSLPDRVHFQASHNYTDEYFDFAKKQMTELFAYDTTGDLISSAWFDIADFWQQWGVGGRVRVEDFAQHVYSLDNDVIQMYNQIYRVGRPGDENYQDPIGIRNFEARYSTPPTAGQPRLTYQPAEYNINLYTTLDNNSPRATEAWFSYTNNSDRIRAHPGSTAGFSDLRTNPDVANDIWQFNDLNMLYGLNLPVGPNGLYNQDSNDLLKYLSGVTNGGGRADNFDVGWTYTGSWTRAFKGSAAAGSWQNTLHTSETAGDSADYEFFGNSVKLYLKTDANAGDVNIYIDGIFRYKFKSTTASDSILAYSTDFLADGKHVLTVEVGEEVEVTTGHVSIDYIEVAPRIWRVAVDSQAGNDKTYSAGDHIDIVAFFTGEVKVTGAPQLEITVGDEARLASYTGGTGTRELRFRYTVAAGDADANGVSVGLDKVKLNGGVIQVNDGGSARTTDADLSHKSMAAEDAHLIDGGPGTSSLSIQTAGNDLLVGLAGDNSYQLGLDTGFDEVYEGYVSSDSLTGDYLRASGDASDTIRLDAGIAVGDVQLLRDHSSVWVQVLGAADGEGNRQVVSSIKLVNYYENDQSKIEQIVFADGTVWGRSQLHKVAIGGGSGDDSLYGRDDMADIFDGSAGGNDRLVGLGGNDEYRLGFKTGFDQIYEGYTRDYGASSSYLSWGRGTASWSMEQVQNHPSSEYLRPSGDAGDLIRLDAGIAAGDVQLVREGGSLLVQLLGPADVQGTREVVASLQVVDHFANEQSKVERIVFADGGEWSGDFQVGTSGNDEFNGTSANETFYGGGGADIYKFGADFGSDTVAGDSGSGKAVFSGYGSGRLRFAKDGNDLLVSAAGSADQARFTDWLAPGGSQKIEANNGQSLEVAKIIEALSVIQSDGLGKPQSILIAENEWTPIGTSA
ncbi:MAG: alpha-L-fucosidase [Betaproteobacteria bacterium]|nr:alpha-L-fucosidase [Betaproteobacteria bacterium]